MENSSTNYEIKTKKRSSCEYLASKILSQQLNNSINLKTNFFETHGRLRKKAIDNFFTQKRARTLILDSNIDNNPQSELSSYNLVTILPINKILEILLNENSDYTSIIQSINSLVKLSSKNLEEVNQVIINNHIDIILFKKLEKYSEYDLKSIQNQDLLIINEIIWLFGNLFSLNDSKIFESLEKRYTDDLNVIKILSNFLLNDNKEIFFQTIFALNNYCLENEKHINYIFNLGIFEKTIQMAKTKGIAEKDLTETLAFILTCARENSKKNVFNISSCFQLLTNLLLHKSDLIVQLTIQILTYIIKKYDNISNQSSIIDNLNEVIKNAKGSALINDSLTLLINISNKKGNNNLIVNSPIFTTITNYFCNENVQKANKKLDISIFDNILKLFLNLVSTQTFLDSLKENNFYLLNSITNNLNSKSYFTTHIILSICYSLIGNHAFSNLELYFSNVLLYKLIELIQFGSNIVNLTISACLIYKIISNSQSNKEMIKVILQNSSLLDVVSNYLSKPESIYNERNFKTSFIALETKHPSMNDDEYDKIMKE